MPREKLFPDPDREAGRTAKQRFENLASRVLTISKRELDDRENRWREERDNEKTDSR